MANMINWRMEDLYNGCILASIAHAIMVAHYPLAANQHKWDGNNYCVLNSSGAQGIITFSDNVCVAAFRDFKSERAELTVVENLKNALEYFLGADEEIIELAKTEPLQYLYIGPDDVGFEESNDEDDEVPLITAAFWGNKDGLLTVDSFEDFFENGGYLLEIQSMEFEDAVDEWEDIYNMNDEQIELLKSLYAKKIANPNEEILLSKSEIAMIGEPEYKEEGMNACVESFKELNIALEI